MAETMLNKRQSKRFVGFLMPQDLYKPLKQKAVEDHRSISGYLRKLINSDLDRQGKQHTLCRED